jgi:hypothetical protein
MVKKEKRSGYLSPKTLLNKDDYKRYREQRRIIERAKLEKRMEERESKIPAIKAQSRYSKSSFGKVGKGISKGFQFIQSPTSVMYSRNVPVIPNKPVSRTSKTLRKGYNYKPGRPKGTYDLRYAKFGGVYGYRRYLSSQLREQRMQMLRDRAISPQQQIILRQIEAREAASKMSPEARVIPSTAGEVYLDGLMDEINSAANIVN